MFDKLLEWDRDAFIYLNGLGIEKYDGFWYVVTNGLSWIPIYLLFFVLIYLNYRKKEAFSVVATIGSAVLVVLALMQVTKTFVARLRPSSDPNLNTLIRIVTSPGGYSFFSGHAAASFCLTTLVVLFLRKKFKWIWVFYLWPLLFSLSRIYVGVHYPLDLIVGALVGTLCAFLFFTLHQKFRPPYSE
ncbi:phosphatase PAP2 family protein [Flavobacteriaceae bacterium F89]|uniref:Phosphatase PAP2 family protein n=1 Tax=Cerina litoralis TaxID=2874477 RepID=A0AAE3JPM6_9FLAO|nr:phosphatase PAP2 family protein [Cerina litoralis]MCG2461206.1 phosphatase PAP2 family protein [Cerina litoralis]